MKKYILRILFAILPAAIVLLPLLPKAEAEEYTYAKALYYQYGGSGDTYEMTFFTPEGEICRLPAGAGKFYIDMALDRSYAFVILDFNKEHGGEFYFVSPEGAKHIAGGVYACLSSDEGGNAAYITDFSGGDTCTLNLYNGKDGKTRCIDENMWAHTSWWYNHAAISPDGNSLVYCRYGEDGAPEGMLWKKGKYTSLGDALPIAVADKAEYIYYARADTDDYSERVYSDYYVLGKRGEARISPEPVSGTFYFNRDFSEALFNYIGDGESISYFCVDGEVMQANAHIPPIDGIAAPDGELAGEFPDLDPEKRPQPEYYYRYGIDSFRGKTLLVTTSIGWCGNNYVYPVYYVDHELQVSEPYNYGSETFTMRGSSAIYSYGGGLYYLENFPEGEPVQVGNTNIAALGEEGQVYYACVDGLCLWEKGSSRHVIDDGRLVHHSRNCFQDRSTPYNFSLNFGYLPAVDGSLYYQNLSGDTLYCLSPEGGIETLLTDVEDVHSAYFFEGIPVVLIRTDDDCVDAYRLHGAAATLIVEDMLG